MPEFTYSARTAEGASRIGTLILAAAGDVVSELRSRGWIVLDVQAVEQSNATESWSKTWFSPAYWLPATRFDMEIGLQQLATMIRSGLTLLTSLRTAAEQARRPAMARVWARIEQRIESGSSFADAMSQEPRFPRWLMLLVRPSSPWLARAMSREGRFPPLVVQLVRVGETSGTLDVVLTRATEHLERSRSLRALLLTAMMYPAFVLVSAVGVAAFMVFSVIPKLQKFIRARGHKLPAITQALLDTTNFLNAHLVSILSMIALLLMAFLMARRIRATRLWIDAVMLRVPVIGGILRLSGTAAVARGLSLLLSNGINLLDAIRTTEGLLTNQAMRRRMELARESVMEGKPFAESLRAGREFLPMMARMTAVGEATGTLDPVLEEVAMFHEAQLAGAVRRFSLMVEPLIIVIVGGIVGFVYIAFFVALFAVAGGG